MSGRESLNKYIDEQGGRPEAARTLGIPYSTLAAICNGTRGIGRDLAQRIEQASGGSLSANELIWVEPSAAPASQRVA